QSQLIEEDDPEFDIENKFDTLTTITSSTRTKKKQDHNKVKKNTHNDPRFKGHRLIEPPVTNENLCDLVKATSYLSFKEYWEVPNKIELVASFLDPRIKNMKFFGDQTTRTTTFDMVRALCTGEEHCQPSVRLVESSSTPSCEPATTNGLIAALYSSEELDDEIYDETEVDRYLREPIEKRGCNPLTWWKDRSEKYP
ncbi:31561_t:CDS:2, partial [Gigaspora margarita]